MSKKKLERATERIRVQAFFTHNKKVNGEITGIPLYNIYGPRNLKRN